MTTTNKCSGVYLPLSSLSGNYGIGSLLEGGIPFIDFLAQSGFTYWFVGPIEPYHYDESPFSPCCGRALNPDVIDIRDLFRKGLVTKSDIDHYYYGSDVKRTSFYRVYPSHMGLLEKAYYRFMEGDERQRRGFKSFLYHFPNDYAQYYFSLRLDQKKEEELFPMFTQYLFDRQWKQLADYAHKNKIQLIGTMPYYLSLDSYEMRLHPHFFREDQAQPFPAYDYIYLKKHHTELFRSRYQFLLHYFDGMLLDSFDAYFQRKKEDSLFPYAERLKGNQFLDEFLQGRNTIIDTKEIHSYPKDNIYYSRYLIYGYKEGNASLHHPLFYDDHTISFSSSFKEESLMYFLETLTSEERSYVVRRVKQDLKEKNLPFLEEEDNDSLRKAMLTLNLASEARLAIFTMADLLGEKTEVVDKDIDLAYSRLSYRISKEDLFSLDKQALKEQNESFGRF